MQEVFGQDVFSAIGQVWALRAPAALLAPGGGVATGIGVALVAALSWVLGHAVVFGINKVTGMRMLAGIGVGVLYVAAVRVLIAFGIALLAWLVSGERAAAATIGVTYLYALAPLVLSVLIFIPHLGIGIGRVLEVWSVLALTALLVPTLGVGRWQALLIAALAWLLGLAVSRLAAKPVALVSSRIWTLATGQQTFVTAADVLSGAPFIPVQAAEAR